jgi:hypothetical protein
VAAFAAGGGVVGFLHRLPVPNARHIAYVAGGIVAMYGIMFATQVDSRHDVTEWIVFGCLGAVLELALAARQPA